MCACRYNPKCAMRQSHPGIASAPAPNKQDCHHQSAANYCTSRIAQHSPAFQLWCCVSLPHFTTGGKWGAALLATAECISRIESVLRDQDSDQPDVKTVRPILTTSIQQALQNLCQHKTQLQPNFIEGPGCLRRLAAEVYRRLLYLQFPMPLPKAYVSDL